MTHVEVKQLQNRTNFEEGCTKAILINSSSNKLKTEAICFKHNQITLYHLFITNTYI